jgi:hypothetical protein
MMVKTWTSALLVLLAELLCHGALYGAELGVVPLFDGERSDNLNLWGGTFSAGNTTSFVKQTSIVHSGAAAYRTNLGALANNASRFFQTFSSAVNGTPGYRQDRDLTQFQSLEGYVRNDAGVPLTFSLELKDYRDSGAQKATRSYTIPAGGWTKIEAPLDFQSGWNVTGTPDFSRTFAMSFLVNADFGAGSGSLYLDDFRLVENGPSIDTTSAPIDVVVERLAHRQFSGLWAARNKTSGLIPNSADDVTRAALNTTTGVVWTLPTAIRRGWVAQADADAFMGQLVNSLNVNRNQSTYLPTRFLDLVTAAPVDNREESSIDASFIALALHNYKSQPATPAALNQAIDALENRFNWTLFSGAGAFKLAYIPATGFSQNEYLGYTNENKVISLAAEASTAHHVPLETMWNKDVGRTLVNLVDPNQKFLVYSYGTDYRATFAQALVNIFVDISDRGVDSFSNRTLARNSWVNYVRYESEVSDKLQQLGRDHFFQPDAADGAAGYKPYNFFNDFGQPNLFMPWSVSLALLAGTDGADDALRFLLDNGLGSGLDGPLGLTDSAQWATGAANPTDVPSIADNWNMTLSTLALLEFLDRYQGTQSASNFFASLSEIDAALDRVFIDGDLNGNGVVNAADLAILRGGFGAAFNATPATGDADGDGDVDGADFLRWQRGLGPHSPSTSIPEPAAGIGLAAGAVFLLWSRRKRQRVNQVDASAFCRGRCRRK